MTKFKLIIKYENRLRAVKILLHHNRHNPDRWSQLTERFAQIEIAMRDIKKLK